MALADIPAVYLIGSARSGTTWLQRMLASHPEIASPNELDFFSRYVAPWYRVWDSQLDPNPAAGQRPRFRGVPAVLTGSEFEELVREAVERIYRTALAAKPSARIVLEKDPNYSLCTAEIVRTVPHARFIHLLRDGRDASASMTRVSLSWGRDWAPRKVRAAATGWRNWVENAREAVDAPGGYLELRYEDLLTGEGPSLLAKVLTFCGASDDPGLAFSLYERYRKEPGKSKEELLQGGIIWGGEARARLGPEPPQHGDFIGEAAAGAWRRQFAPRDRGVFDSVAGTLLVELGYEPDREWVGHAGRVLSADVRLKRRIDLTRIRVGRARRQAQALLLHRVGQS